MKRLNETDIIDYLDGTLSPARMAEVEAHLRTHEEDAQLVADLKMAQGELIAWDASEPVQVSANFWPQLRDKLPAGGPRRSWLSRLSSIVWPSQSPLATPIRVMVVAAFLALVAALATPEQARQNAVATRDPKALTNADKAFIERSIQNHNNYSSSQPLGGTNVDKRGDVASSETGDDETVEETTP